MQMSPFAVIFAVTPERCMFPLTSSFSVGLTTPNPILPVGMSLVKSCLSGGPGFAKVNLLPKALCLNSYLVLLSVSKNLNSFEPSLFFTLT